MATKEYQRLPATYTVRTFYRNADGETCLYDKAGPLTKHGVKILISNRWGCRYTYDIQDQSGVKYSEADFYSFRIKQELSAWETP